MPFRVFLLTALLAIAIAAPAFPEKQNPDIYAWAKTKKAAKPAAKKTAKKPALKTKATAKMATPKQAPSKPPEPPRVVTSEPPKPLPAQNMVQGLTLADLPTRATRYVREFSSGFGQQIVGQQTVFFNMQMRVLSSPKRPLYFGLDSQFTLYNPGYSLSLLPAAWWDFTLRSNPVLNFTIGLLAGPTFSKNTPLIPDQSFEILAETSLAFELSDLSAVRGQFRTGIVGGRLAFSSGILIGYRFR